MSKLDTSSARDLELETGQIAKLRVKRTRGVSDIVWVKITKSLGGGRYVGRVNSEPDRDMAGYRVGNRVSFADHNVFDHTLVGRADGMGSPATAFLVIAVGAAAVFLLNR